MEELVEVFSLHVVDFFLGDFLTEEEAWEPVPKDVLWCSLLSPSSWHCLINPQSTGRTGFDKIS